MKRAATLVIVSGEGMCAEECAHPFFGDERREKIARMKIETGKKQMALAEAAVLAGMKMRFGKCVKNAYRYQSSGKPEAAYAEHGYLSIAHAGDFGACIWADVPVGMDIEKSDRTIDRILNRIANEKDAACERPIEIWCAKESYVKLTGEGLGKPFCGICAKKDRIEADGHSFYLSKGTAGDCVWAVTLKEKRDIDVIFLHAREALSRLNA